MVRRYLKQGFEAFPTRLPSPDGRFPALVSIGHARIRPMTGPQKVAWNRGRVVGKKPLLTPDKYSLIRLLLRQDSRTQSAAARDLALFSVILDT